MNKHYIYLKRDTKGVDTSLYFGSSKSLKECKEWIMKQYGRLARLHFSNAIVYTFDGQQEKLNIKITLDAPRMNA